MADKSTRTAQKKQMITISLLLLIASIFSHPPIIDIVVKSPSMAFYSAESEKCHFHFPHKLLLLSQKVREQLFAHREAKSVVSASLTDQ
jgi:hypothetical protein